MPEEAADPSEQTGVSSRSALIQPKSSAESNRTAIRTTFTALSRLHHARPTPVEVSCQRGRCRDREQGENDRRFEHTAPMIRVEPEGDFDPLARYQCDDTEHRCRDCNDEIDTEPQSGEASGTSTHAQTPFV